MFYPREARRYHETIPFEINGLSTMNVEIFGEGTDMKVQINVICSSILDVVAGLLLTIYKGSHAQNKIPPRSSLFSFCDTVNFTLKS